MRLGLGAVHRACVRPVLYRCVMTATPSLSLTQHEQWLCTLLDDTCRWMTATNPSIDVDGTARRFRDMARPSSSPTLACEARVAGGWVRDKLLGLPSHDLDISLSTLTGHHFALFLREYLQSDAFGTTSLAQAMDKQWSREESISHIGKIAANPEQSKNLETATARVLGLDLDFVNLRKEEYEGTSRIPVMSFGTPFEDAMRRDITVNAMFYNVHTHRVEDWTEHGWEDLQAGLVRTPLEPVSTFRDDPLRILRCVRFASRFHYRIHEDIRATLRGQAHGAQSSEEAQATAQELRDALTCKVSRERFGIEVDKMLSGRDPLHALELLTELELYRAVFLPPPPHDETLYLSHDQGTSNEGSLPALSPQAMLRVAACLHGILHQCGPYADLWRRMPRDWVDAFTTSEHAAPMQRLLWYAVALLPLQHIYYHEKKKAVWAGVLTIASGLKLGNRTTKDPVLHLHTAAQLLSRPSLDRFQPAPMTTRRSTIGLLLRHASITNPTLYVELSMTLLFAMLSDLAPYCHDGPLDIVQAERIVDEFATFWTYVADEELAQFASAKPLLDGRQVADVLGCEKHLISRIQPYVFAWQMDHMDHHASHAEHQAACIADLKHAWDQGYMVPEEERQRFDKRQKK